MEERDNNYCDNCEHRHITTLAEVWCSECNERYCSSCLEYHNAFKATKDHETIPISDYNKLPSLITDLSSYCEEHQDSYQLYCQKHEQCCCLRCIKQNHRACTEVDVLRDVIKGVKTSTSLEDIEICLKTINNTYERLAENRLQNICRLMDQKETIFEELRNIKISVNRHIDDLISSTEKSILVKIEKENLEINSVLKEVETRKAKIHALMDEESLMKQFSTELQTFLVLPTLQKYIKEESGYIESLQNEHKVDEVDLNFEKSSFCEEAESLGAISISKSTCLVNFDVWKKQRAQNLFLNEEDFFNKDVLKACQIFYPLRKNKTSITGCTILPNGHLLFCDNNNGELYDRSTIGDISTVVNVKDLWDVTFTEDGKIAITTFGGTLIKVINHRNGRHISDIVTNEKCFGIEFSDDRYYVKSRGKFLVIGKDGNILFKIKNTCLACVSGKDDKILGSNRDSDFVECYSTDGPIMWKFQSNILRHPRDLTTDGDGYVYVVGKESNNVIVISADGKRHKELLNKSDGLNAPVAIHFEKTLKQLLVCNESGDAFVYDIK